MQDQKPSLLLIGGPPGSGKSTLAKAIAKNLQWQLLDKDTIKSTLLVLEADEELASRASYELLIALAADSLRCGVSVILDAPAGYAEFLERCRSLATYCDATFHTVLCLAPIKIRHDRLRQRQSRRSQWTQPDKKSDDSLSKWKNLFPNDVIVVETGNDPDIESLARFVVSRIVGSTTNAMESTQNPKSGIHVAVAVFDSEQRILMVKQNYRDRLWSLPGGTVEALESPINATIRETEEETGFLIDVSAYIGTYAAPERNMISLLFLGELLGNNGWKPNAEISDIGFFKRLQLPTPMSPRMRFRIQDAFEGRRGIFRIGESALLEGQESTGGSSL